MRDAGRLAAAPGAPAPGDERARRRVLLAECSTEPRAFRASASIARLTIADVDEAGPVLEEGPGGVECLVVVWPTGSDGRLSKRAVQAGECDVRRWILTPTDLVRLRQIARDWALERCDLLVSQRWIGPCPETLRSHAIGVWPVRRLERVRRASASPESLPDDASARRRASAADRGGVRLDGAAAPRPRGRRP